MSLCESIAIHRSHSVCQNTCQREKSMCSIRHVTVTGWPFSTALSVKCVSHRQTAELEGLAALPLWSVTGQDLIPRPLLPPPLHPPLSSDASGE